LIDVLDGIDVSWGRMEGKTGQGAEWMTLYCGLMEKDEGPIRESGVVYVPHHPASIEEADEARRSMSRA
jgi:hypothetical protein